MSVNIEEYHRLEKTVKNLMKIIGAFNSSMKSLKEKVFKLEDKVYIAKAASVKKESAQSDSEINSIKELSNKNKQSIEIIDIKMKKLEEDHSELSEKCRLNENKADTIHSNVVRNKEKLNECLQKIDEINPSSDSNSFESNNYGQLKKHVSSLLTPKYKCKVCEQEFISSYHMVIHLMNDHNQEKEFKCNLCEATFMFKWKLDKHSISHQERRKTRTCHYYNNGKHCPFSYHGCKFLHEEADNCKYADKCKKVMCQFKH